MRVREVAVNVLVAEEVPKIVEVEVEVLVEAVTDTMIIPVFLSKFKYERSISLG